LVTDTLPPATRTNTYLLRGERAVWIIDLGTSDPDQMTVFMDALRTHAMAWRRDIGGLILTHHHPDHVMGLKWWSETIPLPVIAHEKTKELIAEKLGEGGAEIVEKAEWLTISEDQDADGFRLVCTPGHAPGHISVFTGSGRHNNAENVLIAGDLVAGLGTIVIGPPRGNMSDYLASLDKAAALKPELLLPSHGPGTTDAVARLEQYKAHRLKREEKVRAALSPDGQTAAEVTAVAYDDVPVYLHGFAEWTVHAHLIRLVELGECTVVNDRFRAS
jgi:glyoxylase-like metal-dependent hydrolase (beta-lactamase superfamily II)